MAKIMIMAIVSELTVLIMVKIIDLSTIMKMDHNNFTLGMVTKIRAGIHCVNDNDADSGDDEDNSNDNDTYVTVNTFPQLNTS